MASVTAPFQPQNGITSREVLYTVRRIESARPFVPPYFSCTRLESRVLFNTKCSDADDSHFQPHPVPPPNQPNLLFRLRNVMHPQSNAVMVRYSTIDQLARCDRSTRGVAGIGDATSLKQKGTLGSNIPDEMPSINTTADLLSTLTKQRQPLLPV
jgi:hypothetical protein